jgi:hypothetical protein
LDTTSLTVSRQQKDRKVNTYGSVRSSDVLFKWLKESGAFTGLLLSSSDQDRLEDLYVLSLPTSRRPIAAIRPFLLELDSTSSRIYARGGNKIV